MANEREPTKVAIFGAEGVGKTAIVNRMVYDTFTQTHHRTIGVEFFTKTIYDPKQTETIFGRRFQLWDTAGAERYQFLTCEYSKEASLLLFVWDAQQPNTLDKLNDFLAQNSYAITLNTHVLFIRNKVDEDKDGTLVPALSEDDRKKIEGPEGYVEKFGIKHHAIIDMSAKHNTGFDELEKKMLEAPEPAPIQKPIQVQPYAPFDVANSYSLKRPSACCNFFRAPLVQMGSGALIAAAGLAAALTSKQLAAWLFLKLLVLATVPPAAATVLLVIGIALIAAGALVATNGAKNMICRPAMQAYKFN